MRRRGGTSHSTQSQRLSAKPLLLQFDTERRAVGQVVDFLGDRSADAHGGGGVAYDEVVVVVAAAADEEL